MIAGYDFMTCETCPYHANTRDMSTVVVKSEQILGKSRLVVIFDREIRREVLKVNMLFRHFTFFCLIFYAFTDFINLQHNDFWDLLVKLAVRIQIQIWACLYRNYSVQ